MMVEHVTIICRTCNAEFQQFALMHVSGQGCFKCASKDKAKTNEQFLLDAHARFITIVIHT